MSRSEAVTWFEVFRAAERTGDRELAQLARKQLEELGYRVAVVRQRSSRAPAEAAAQ